MKLLKNVALIGLRDSEPGIVDVDTHAIGSPTAADDHAAFRRVFDGIGNQVLQQTAQQAAIRLHQQRAGHERQLQAPLTRQRRKFDLELAKNLIDAEVDEFGPHGAAVKSGNVEQRTKYLLDGVERGIDIRRQLSVLAT